MFVLKVCTRFVCSCFVAPRVVLSGRSEEKEDGGGHFFLFILFFKILIRSLDSILETEVKLKKKNLMFFGNLSTCW